MGTDPVRRCISMFNAQVVRKARYEDRQVPEITQMDSFSSQSNSDSRLPGAKALEKDADAGYY
jgi:hypothetical protein